MIQRDNMRRKHAKANADFSNLLKIMNKERSLSSVLLGYLS